jgi:hypothetical protein
MKDDADRALLIAELEGDLEARPPTVPFPRTAILAVLSSNIALSGRFAVAPRDHCSYSSIRPEGTPRRIKGY